MFVQTHTLVAWFICGFSSIHAELTNVALGSSCCASTEHDEIFSCEKAVDGDIVTDYASDKEGVGMWYKMDLGRSYYVTTLRIMDRYNPVEKNRDLRLTFSDGTTQMITLPNSGTGYHWVDFSIIPVSTYSLSIAVMSVYTTYNNGFLEVEVLADTSVIPTVQVEVCPLNITGTWSTSPGTLALVKQYKKCLAACARTIACVAVLLHVGGESCVHYHLECVADKAQYGTGYFMWRPKRPANDVLVAS